jgi:hypothetical protein
MKKEFCDFKENETSMTGYVGFRGGLKMKKLKMPASKLKKKMYNLILDGQARDIKLSLFKKGQSIPELYDEINPVLKHNKVHIARSTFKNMLMDSSTQTCDWEKRLKVINLIFENLYPDKINAAYLSVKLFREKEIRSIMKLLKSDYKDKREYLPEEVLEHEMENLPDDMKTYWETWKDE